ncbi:uncharacterized protein B0I36DRAFT_356304 [Microdochium trichocladiopsis]|uniref:Uncharacterized protein n=1 Tax=Microdochium trichocladiopsis TaxID=1682393 RepID=A0A9P8XTU7_9PEZI|nr:uncharacterized protein B0I36DRAFT_356304 [Microdochium trichocladiopsis]KAH7012224.1 hypothetical protein B0I36DRAFT_356304 [Microdochium trichocladiopsis]
MNFEDVSRKLDAMKIVALYRVRGGTAKGRSRKIRDLSRAFYTSATQEEGIESAVWLYEDHDAAPNIDWTEIHDITELGTKAGSGRAQIITLPDPFDPSYTTYKVSAEELVITLHPPFGKSLWGLTDKKGLESLQWILDGHARRVCVVNWCAGKVDATCLPHLPEKIKELKLCGMPRFLADPVPWNPCNHHHWIHEFVEKLQALQKLTLSGCGYRSDDLPPLRNWIDSLEINVEKEAK